MKNSMLKGAHLSEKKCKEMLHLFAEDLTATQIAHITGVSRVTVNSYLKLIRTHIAKFCEERNPKYLHQHLVPFIPLHHHAKQQDENNNATGVFGFLRYEGKIFADWIANIDRESLMALQKTKYTETFSVPPAIASYHAIADFDRWNLYRLEQFVNGQQKNNLDDIAGFWGNTKSRLMKFRGLNKNTLYLHVKESEFRYNYRNDDINTLLKSIIQNRPLHLSRMYE